MYFDSLIYIIKNIKGHTRSVTHAHARPVNFLGYAKIITEFVYEKLPNYKQKGFFVLRFRFHILRDVAWEM